ncbi:MAG: hypothetical protein ACP5D6_11725 [Kosmotogaceae bacterium]
MEGIKNETIGIGSIVEIIKSKNREIEFVRVPLFELSANDFLTYAKSDLVDNDEKGLINALSNAKRAISNRIDEIIMLSLLRKISLKQRWNIPTKMDKLGAIGIFVPGILQRKITSKRNLLEHEYIKPKDSQDVVDIIEIAKLFLASTERYIELGRLGAIDPLDGSCILFNIFSGNIEIYMEDHDEIIEISQINEDDLMDLAKELTNIKTHGSYSVRHGDESWDEFHAEKINHIRRFGT